MNYIAQSFSYIVNLSITTSIHLKHFKIAELVPVHKTNNIKLLTIDQILLSLNLIKLSKKYFMLKFFTKTKLYLLNNLVLSKTAALKML